jgi:hypothetical protein
MELLTQLPVSLKVGWLVVMGWTIAQVIWFAHVRSAPPPAPVRRPDSSTRRSAVKTPIATVLPTGGSPEFLAELGLHDPDADSRTHESVYR